jgi:hypothetical protein
MAGPDGARSDLPQMEMLREFSSRHWPEAVMAASVRAFARIDPAGAFEPGNCSWQIGRRFRSPPTAR